VKLHASVKDRTGQKFGVLTAVAPTKLRVGNSVVWRCVCDCGLRVERSGRYFNTAGEIASCGCLNRGRASPLARDLTGDRYGRLTVVGYADDGGQGLRWRCACDCGNFSIARAKDLRVGTTTSCGCGKAGGGRPRRGGGRWGTGLQPGEKFGLLTVEELLGVEGGARQYRCACECGGTTTVRGGLLTTGQTRSCGCLKRLSHVKREENRRREIQTADKLAASLKATVEFRLALNASGMRGGLMRCEPA
jgi:hypothetical protein